MKMRVQHITFSKATKTIYSSRLFLSQIMCQLCHRDCSFIILTSDQAVRYNETHAVNIEIFIKRKGFNINSKSLFLLELQDVKRITPYNLTLAHRPALSLFFAH